MQLKAALAQAVSDLSLGAQPQQARRDAELLLMHALGCTRTFVLSRPEAELNGEQLQVFQAAIFRRKNGEPIQYITGEQEFYGLRFAVTPDVLIPRPETEHLVEALLERVDKHAHLRMVDVGTGSGAIAIALAKHLPLAKILAVDISAAALKAARANAEAHEVAERIRFLESDLLSVVRSERFDIVVSNPPYVPEADRDSLSIEVREHEPPLALFAGPTGMDIYDRLIPQARVLLAPDGWLLMEIGYNQRNAVERLLRGWTEIEFIADLRGIPRVVCARR